MDFNLSPDLIQMRDTVEKLMRDVAQPAAKLAEREGRFPREAVAKLGAEGVFGTAFAESVGGSALGFQSVSVISETVSRLEPGFGYCMNLQGMTCPLTIFNWGTDDQVRRFVPDLIAGRKIGICEREHSFGTRAELERLRARRVGHVERDLRADLAHERLVLGDALLDTMGQVVVAIGHRRAGAGGSQCGENPGVCAGDVIAAEIHGSSFFGFSIGSRIGEGARLVNDRGIEDADGDGEKRVGFAAGEEAHAGSWSGKKMVSIGRANSLEIAKASGSLQLIAGQVADVEGEGKKLGVAADKRVDINDV